MRLFTVSPGGKADMVAAINHTQVKNYTTVQRVWNC